MIKIVTSLNHDQVIKTLSLNHKGKNLVNINDEVKNPTTVIKTQSLNHKGKNLVNINDKVKNPTPMIKK